MRAPLDWSIDISTQLVDDHVRRPRDREEDAVGDVVGRERPRALVDGLRLRLVAAEADDRELRLDEAARRPW